MYVTKYGVVWIHIRLLFKMSCIKYLYFYSTSLYSYFFAFQAPFGLLAAGRDVDSPLSSFTITLLKLRVIGRNEFLAHLIRWRRCLQIFSCLKLNVRKASPQLACHYCLWHGARDRRDMVWMRGGRKGTFHTASW